MNSHTFFTIIIPTYNRQNTVCRSIDSVLAQDYKKYEIIVINDGSTADYTNVVNKYLNQITYIKHEYSKGVSAARNTGIRAAKGGWLVFLDDDDEYKSHYLGELNKAIGRAPDNVGFAWCSVENCIYLENGIHKRVREYPVHNYNDRALVLESITIGAGYGLGVKKSALQDIGTFNDDYKIAEDTDLIIRFLSSGVKPMVVPTVGVSIHHHKDTRLTEKNYHAISESSVYERIFKTHENFLKKNLDIYLKMVIWCVKVHLMAGDYIKANQNISFLNTFWKYSPAKVFYYYTSLKVLTLSLRLFKKDSIVG